MSYVPPRVPGSEKIIHGLEPETEIDLGLGSSVAAESEIASGVGAAGMWSPDAMLIEHRSLWGEIWRRFRRDKFAMVGVVIIIGLIAVALLAPWIAPHDPTKQYDEGLTMEGMPVGSSSQFLLGTDTLGRDLLSRLMYGARVSLVVGVLANGFALVLGVIFGLTAGYFRGWAETLLMRMTDVMMAFPIILLAVALVSVLKPSIWILILVIGIVYWTPMTRVIHGEVLRIREKEFVDAARLTGCSSRRILVAPHPAAPHPVHPRLHQPGPRHDDPLRSDAQLHRPRHPAADAVLGADDQRRPVVLPLGPAPGHLSRSRDHDHRARVQPRGGRVARRIRPSTAKAMTTHRGG